MGLAGRRRGPLVLGGDVGAAVGNGERPSLFPEVRHRLAGCDLGDAVLLHQRLLARDGPVRGDVAPADPGGDLLGDLLVERGLTRGAGDARLADERALTLDRVGHTLLAKLSG